MRLAICRINGYSQEKFETKKDAKMKRDYDERERVPMKVPGLGNTLADAWDGSH